MSKKYEFMIWLALKALRFLANKKDNDLTHSVVDFLEKIFRNTARNEIVQEIIRVVEEDDPNPIIKEKEEGEKVSPFDVLDNR